MVLDRNPDNFFAETEQVAFCPGEHRAGNRFFRRPAAPGPAVLLPRHAAAQPARVGPNLHQIPINAPKCPVRQFSARRAHADDGSEGRVAYEPNFAPDAPARSPKHGFRIYPRPESGQAVRVRSESFADHYSQARLFYRSQTKPEQDHLAMALVFELGKVEIPAIRERVLTHLVHVDPSLADRVAKGLGLTKTPPPAPTTAPPKDLPASPTLSIVNKARETLRAESWLASSPRASTVRRSTSSHGVACQRKAKLFVVAPQIAGATRSTKANQPGASRAHGGASRRSSTAVVLALGPSGGEELSRRVWPCAVLRPGLSFGALEVHRLQRSC